MFSGPQVRSQAGEEQGPADLGLKELEAFSISEDAIRTILPAPDCSSNLALTVSHVPTSLNSSLLGSQSAMC